MSYLLSALLYHVSYHSHNLLKKLLNETNLVYQNVLVKVFIIDLDGKAYIKLGLIANILRSKSIIKNLEEFEQYFTKLSITAIY